MTASCPMPAKAGRLPERSSVKAALRSTPWMEMVRSPSELRSARISVDKTVGAPFQVDTSFPSCASQTCAELRETVSTRFESGVNLRSEEHTSELQSLRHLVCRLL